MKHRVTSARRGSAETSLGRRISEPASTDDHAALRLLALGLAAQPGGGHRVVDDLPLERGHRLQLHRLAGGLDRLGRRRGPARRARPRGRRGTRRCPASAGCGPRSRGQHGQPGQLLQRLQHHAVPADQVRRRSPPTIETEARSPLDVHVDVAVEVGDVQQVLEVVGRDLALLLEIAAAAPGGACCRRASPAARSVGPARRRLAVVGRRPLLVDLGRGCDGVGVAGACSAVVGVRPRSTRSSRVVLRWFGCRLRHGRVRRSGAAR